MSSGLFFVFSNGFTEEVKSNRCGYCGELVDLLGPDDEWYITRINGDSRYGYEPNHMTCGTAGQ